MTKAIRDLVIIGGGPSALSAAIYTAREDINTVIYEKAVVGGVPATIDQIDNYPGFPDGVNGMDLAENWANQAKRFGAKIEYGDVSSIKQDGKYHTVIVDGEEVKTKAVLIATGRRNRKTGAPGEEEYYGRGVHYCATCDGAFYVGKKLAVIGGGNSAIQEAIYLTRFASHIDLLVRSTIKASAVLQKELDEYVKKGKITVHLDTTVDEMVADGKHITELKISENGKKKKIKLDGVFVFVGMVPNTNFLDESKVEIDEEGFIKSDNQMATNVPGIFVSGDVRSGATMQIASASGDGVTAAMSIREYLQGFGA